MPLDPHIQKIVDLQKDMPAMHTLPVQKVRDDTPLSGQARAADVFEAGDDTAFLA